MYYNYKYNLKRLKKLEPASIDCIDECMDIVTNMKESLRYAKTNIDEKEIKKRLKNDNLSFKEYSKLRDELDLKKGYLKHEDDVNRLYDYYVNLRKEFIKQEEKRKKLQADEEEKRRKKKLLEEEKKMKKILEKQKEKEEFDKKMRELSLGEYYYCNFDKMPSKNEHLFNLYYAIYKRYFYIPYESEAYIKIKLDDDCNIPLILQKDENGITELVTGEPILDLIKNEYLIFRTSIEANRQEVVNVLRNINNGHTQKYKEKINGFINGMKQLNIESKKYTKK